MRFLLKLDISKEKDIIIGVMVSFSTLLYNKIISKKKQARTIQGNVCFVLYK